MELERANSNTSNHNSNNNSNNGSNSPTKHTKLKITKSLTLRNLTPRERESQSKNKKRRYIHHRDKSVGSSIPNSIRNYTPALIALIDHTKGLQTSTNSALGAYGLNRPHTARSARESGTSANGNISIPLFSQSPPPDTGRHNIHNIHNMNNINNDNPTMSNMPTLTNVESNPSVVKHNKQQSGTFLVNELSSDQAVYGLFLFCILYFLCYFY